MNFVAHHESSLDEESQENEDLKHIKEAPKIFRPIIESIYSRKIV